MGSEIIRTRIGPSMREIQGTKKVFRQTRKGFPLGNNDNLFRIEFPDRAVKIKSGQKKKIKK